MKYLSCLAERADPSEIIGRPYKRGELDKTRHNEKDSRLIVLSLLSDNRRKWWSIEMIEHPMNMSVEAVSSTTAPVTDLGEFQVTGFSAPKRVFGLCETRTAASVSRS